MVERNEMIRLIDEYTKKVDFLKSNLHMCEKAVDFLKRYVKDLFEGNRFLDLFFRFVWWRTTGGKFKNAAARKAG